MGLTPIRVYLDACIVIYLLEEHPIFGMMVLHAFENARNHQFFISPLAELECLVLPLRDDNTLLIKRYKEFFQQQHSLAIDSSIFRIAAALRAHHRLKTPDALHLATAQYHGCSEIWTNDDRLNQVAGGMAINIVKPILSS